MKKYIAVIVILSAIPGFGIAQQDWLYTIRHEWSVVSQDTSRVLLLAQFSNYYKFKRPDSALYYGYKALILARKIKFPKGEVNAMLYLSSAHIQLGNDLKALQLIIEGSRIAEKNNLSYEKALFMHGRGVIYRQSRDYLYALSQFKESKIIFDSLYDSLYSSLSQSNIGSTYMEMNQLDSALYYSQLAYDNAVKIEADWEIYNTLLNLGRIQDKKGNTDLALAYFRKSLSKAFEADNFFDSNFAIAQLYQNMAMTDSSIFYGKKSFEIAQEGGFYKNIIEASIFLSGIYEQRDPRQAIYYSKKAISYNDSINNLIKDAAQKTISDFEEQERKRELGNAKAEFQNRLRLIAFLGSTFTLIVIAIFLFRNNRLKQRAKQNIQKAYDQLKSAQAQLIQSEKMASLGELTAGIAHEIQNPLNFVNNFSEVNLELIDELTAQGSKPVRLLGELREGFTGAEDELFKNIRDNLEKTLHHGRRADAIVKGMLLHSRSSSGVKEPTNINALADEYLRLAYHGLRAKDKTFNATLNTDFDETIGNINIIPQHIGRVLLNLITNAFYSVSSKALATEDAMSFKAIAEGASKYVPTVTIVTKKLTDNVEIKVIDNGTGIPQNVRDKIFQPFFTTKPVGQGTGLGLSISYEIVKAHGGELKVETKAGVGSEFIVRIPIV